MSNPRQPPSSSPQTGSLFSWAGVSLEPATEATSPRRKPTNQNTPALKEEPPQAGFPRYPRYKDSGVEWLGRVPEHWSVCHSRRMFRVRDEPASESDEHLTASQKHGMIPQAVFIELEGRRVVEVLRWKEKLLHVEPNDFVMTLRSFEGGIEWCRLRGSAGYSYVILTPIKDVLPKFFAYLFKSAVYIQALRTTTDLVRDGQALRFSHFVQVPLPVIPLEEQHAIAAFLDRETAKIDALVAEQERLIELLKEKRQAVISHAVTRGLDPGAPMKDSGVGWLGQVPAHWGIASIRRVVQRIEQGWSPECLGRPATAEEWGVMKSGCVNRGIFAEEENKALPDGLKPMPEYEIHVGDVLMSRASGSPDLLGSVAYVAGVRSRLMLSDKIFRIHPQGGIDKRFLALALSSHLMRSQIKSSISGADGLANNLPQSTLKGFVCVVPPEREQVEIVIHVSLQIAKIDDLISEAQRAIELLQERRTALISAAVTGQIDVREVGRRTE